jgi:hypothetical protein
MDSWCQMIIIRSVDETIWIVYFVCFFRGISCGGTYLVLEVDFILVSFFLTHACWYFDVIEQVGQNVLIWSCWWYSNKEELKYKCNTILASWFVSQKFKHLGEVISFLALLWRHLVFLVNGKNNVSHYFNSWFFKRFKLINLSFFTYGNVHFDLRLGAWMTCIFWPINLTIMVYLIKYI